MGTQLARMRQLGAFLCGMPFGFLPFPSGMVGRFGFIPPAMTIMPYVQDALHGQLGVGFGSLGTFKQGDA